MGWVSGRKSSNFLEREMKNPFIYSHRTATVSYQGGSYHSGSLFEGKIYGSALLEIGRTSFRCGEDQGSGCGFRLFWSEK